MSGRYTADAVALYHYLADTLPGDADDVVARAEAGVCVVEMPATTMAEVLYGVARTEEVGGVPLEVSPSADCSTRDRSNSSTRPPTNSRCSAVSPII